MSEPSRKMSYSNDRDSPLGHRKALSGSFLSKLFLRLSRDEENKSSERGLASPDSVTSDRAFSKKSPRAIAAAVQQTRRRRGSLRKAALLGRGAQREKKEMKMLRAEYKGERTYESEKIAPSRLLSRKDYPMNYLGLNSSGESSLQVEYFTRIDEDSSVLPTTTTLPMGKPDQHMILPTTVISPALSYTSTTDDDESASLHLHRITNHLSARESDSYFPPDAISLAHHRPIKEAESPKSMSGIVPGSLPISHGEWDYSETEWWGWVLLFVTWIVFVLGMGSCLGVWSWAWDVGETPYAPPELEDDPTLPIVGYYPALIILTSVMAWVWVIVAWVGMKYFRHTKISGD